MTQDPRVEQRAAEQYVAVRREGDDLDEFFAAVDTGFPHLFATAGTAGIVPAGPPFIRYAVFERGAHFEIEIALPVAAGVPGTGELMAGELPAGQFVVYLHVGAYRATTDAWSGRDLPAAHDRMQGWARERGLDWAGEDSPDGRRYSAYLERYLVGPMESTDPAAWQTELSALIAS